MEPKKRRGGKRFRKMKERYGLTDVRKAANRVNFNQPEEEVIDGDEVRAHRPGHCQKGGGTGGTRGQGSPRHLSVRDVSMALTCDR